MSKKLRHFERNNKNITYKHDEIHLNQHLVESLLASSLTTRLVFLVWPAPILSHLVSTNSQLWSVPSYAGLLHPSQRDPLSLPAAPRGCRAPQPHPSAVRRDVHLVLEASLL